jgi:hypothetical protein
MISSCGVVHKAAHRNDAHRIRQNVTVHPEKAAASKMAGSISTLDVLPETSRPFDRHARPNPIAHAPPSGERPAGTVEAWWRRHRSSTLSWSIAIARRDWCADRRDPRDSKNPIARNAAQPGDGRKILVAVAVNGDRW